MTTVLLQDIACTGEVRSFWACPNGGWGQVTGTCQDPANGFSIYCFSEGTCSIMALIIYVIDAIFILFSTFAHTLHTVCNSFSDGIHDRLGLQHPR